MGSVINDDRRGTIDLVTKILLAGIFCVLAALTFILLSNNRQHSRGGPDNSSSQSDQNAVNPSNARNAQNTQSTQNNQNKAVVRPGERVSRPPQVPPPPPMIGRPERIRDVLQEGKTYEIITTAELTGPVRTKEWGFDTTVNLVYRAEMQMRRTIEKNDGVRVVELRDIVNCRMVKATSTVEVRFVPTEPGALLLGALDEAITGGQVTELLTAVVKPLLILLEGGVQELIDDLNTKISGKIDSLSGKKVRIVFQDGKGVVELQAVDCSLTEDERNLIFASAVLTDAYLLPDKDSKPGDVWDVDGAALTDLLPPSWRGVPKGKVSIKRMRDEEVNGKKYAQLECYYGTLSIDATDEKRSRLGTLAPRGKLKYNITDGHIETIDLEAQATLQEASRDHLLFETRFETAPKVRLTAFCHIINSR